MIAPSAPSLLSSAKRFRKDSSGKIIIEAIQREHLRVFQDQIRSDQISLSVVSNFLRPHVSQHARPPCP